MKSIHYKKVPLNSQAKKYLSIHKQIFGLKEQSRQILAQESADLHEDHWCHHVTILCFQQLTDDVIIVRLIVTSSCSEVSSFCAQVNRVDLYTK